MFSRTLDHCQAVNSNFPKNEVKQNNPDLRLFSSQEKMEKTNPKDNFWGMKCIAKIKKNGSCHIRECGEAGKEKDGPGREEKKSWVR